MKHRERLILSVSWSDGRLWWSADGLATVSRTTHVVPTRGVLAAELRQWTRASRVRRS